MLPGGAYEISTDEARLDIDAIHAYLARSYWSPGIPREIVARAPEGALFVAIGDDRTDEDMFAALPPGGVAIRVGAGDSSAPYRLDSPTAVRALLGALT